MANRPMIRHCWRREISSCVYRAKAQAKAVGRLGDMTVFRQKPCISQDLAAESMTFKAPIDETRSDTSFARPMDPVVGEVLRDMNEVGRQFKEEHGFVRSHTNRQIFQGQIPQD